MADVPAYVVARSLCRGAVNWLRERKIAFLNHTKRTPVVALAQTLEKAQAGKIKSIYISIQWEDDSYDSDWSQMKRSELLMHAYQAQSDITKEMSQ